MCGKANKGDQTSLLFNRFYWKFSYKRPAQILSYVYEYIL